MFNGNIAVGEVSNIVRWSLVLGTFLVTVTTIKSCVQHEDDQSRGQLNQLISEGHDPVIAYCAVDGPSVSDNRSVTCALAIQAQALTRGKMTIQKEAP